MRGIRLVLPWLGVAMLTIVFTSASSQAGLITFTTSDHAFDTGVRNQRQKRGHPRTYVARLGLGALRHRASEVGCYGPASGAQAEMDEWSKKRTGSKKGTGQTILIAASKVEPGEKLGSVEMDHEANGRVSTARRVTHHPHGIQSVSRSRD